MIALLLVLLLLVLLFGGLGVFVRGRAPQRFH
jgi:hypothetical protein